MKIERYGVLVPVALFFYLLISGYKIISPLPLTYDPALHAEIVKYVIPSDFIPSTWKPLSDTAYTYPPLFHWSAFLFSLSGVEAYKIVIFMGLFLYALFPLSFYLYGSAFGKKEAVLFSFFGAVQASLTEVFAAGEYPQLLSMLLILVVFYFIAKKDYPKAGVTSGLVLLAHSFTGIYLLVVLAAYFLSNLGDKKRIHHRQAAAFFVATVLVSSIWIPKYFQIFGNAVNERWENTIWYYKGGLIGIDRINDIFFSFLSGARMGLILLLFSMAGIVYARANKLNLQLLAFLFTAIFTIFHIPGTQYKFPDMLALATPPMAAFGFLWAVKEVRKIQRIAKILLACILITLMIVNPYANATNLRNCCVSKDTPDAAQIKLAEWLKNNDSGPGVVVADGDYEIWFALIAGKYPMNPRVSELEVFTDRYREMLSDRQKLIDEIGKGNYSADLLDKWGVNYIVTGYELKLAGFQLLREENDTKLYKRYA